MVILFRSMVTEATNDSKIGSVFKNRNQRRKRNPYSYAKGLISIFIMTNPPVQSTGTHDKFGVRPTCDLYKKFQLATSVYFLVF